jgi:hypothetical protein
MSALPFPSFFAKNKLCIKKSMAKEFMALALALAGTLVAAVANKASFKVDCDNNVVLNGPASGTTRPCFTFCEPTPTSALTLVHHGETGTITAGAGSVSRYSKGLSPIARDRPMLKHRPRQD